jgi:hypothetical protein
LSTALTTIMDIFLPEWHSLLFLSPNLLSISPSYCFAKRSPQPSTAIGPILLAAQSFGSISLHLAPHWSAVVDLPKRTC